MSVDVKKRVKDSSLQPKVVIIVLNWNGKENTNECLKSLEHIDYLNCDVIVIDNASTDGSQTFLMENFPQITLIENERNLGFGGGFNVGIREAMKRNADYVLCLNNDVVVDKNILRELVKVGEMSTKIGGLCPMEYDYNQPNRIICAGGVIRFVRGKVFGHGELDNGQFSEVRETELLSGPAMMLKLNALLNVGLFDTCYFYGPEDKDIALRLIKRGYRLMFVPNAKLWHKIRGATGGKITPLNVYFSIRNWISFVRKHANRLQFLGLILYFGFFYFPFTLLMRSSHGKRQCIDAAIRGIVWHLNRNLVPTDPQMVKLLLEDHR